MKEEGVYEYTLEAQKDTDIRRNLFARLAERNWPLLGLKTTELTLEDIFLRLTSDQPVDMDEPDNGPMPDPREVRLENRAEHAVVSLDESAVEEAEAAEAAEKSTENGGGEV